MATRFVAPAELGALRERAARATVLLRRPEPLLKRWGVIALRDIGQTFRAGGRPRWRPLSPWTVAGRRKKSSRPLENTGALKRSFDLEVAGNRLEIFSALRTRSGINLAAVHEHGARAATIRPRHAKALAIPAGPKTLSGLGRSRARSRGGFVFKPGAGQRVPKRLAGRRGKPVQPFKKLLFRKQVRRGPIPARPMLPTLARVREPFERAADALIRKALQPKTQGSG